MYILHYRLCLMTLMEAKNKAVQFWEAWRVGNKSRVSINYMLYLASKIDNLSSLHDLFFTKKIIEGEGIYTHTTYTIHSMPETVAHRILRSSKRTATQISKVIMVCLHYVIYVHYNIYTSKSEQYNAIHFTI